MKAFCCCLLFVCSFSFSRGQSDIRNPYPFTLRTDNGKFVIEADVQDNSLYPKYHSIFTRYGYTGNGYSWAGIIEQLLRNEAPALLKTLEFEPETGIFYAYANSDTERQQFIQIICPVFSNLRRLENVIKIADRSQIED